MGYDKLILYYFSGTGNARRAALWAEGTARSSGIQADVRDIGKMESGNEPLPAENVLIGFFFPTHGFTLIWAMLKFILLFPISRGKASVFAVATRAGLKFGRLYVPGYEGNGLLIALLALWIKGYRMVGSLPLDMPSNWTAVHPSLSMKNCADMSERCRIKVQQFTERLLLGGRCLYGWKTLPMAIASLPIAAVYLLFGRFFIAKTMIADSRCDGCRLCERICPVHAIRFVRERPYWTLSCESCQRCINFCPKSAIQSSHSIGLLLYLITYGRVSDMLWQQTHLSFGIWNNAIYCLYYFTALCAGYMAFHFASRWRPISLFIEYTSLTRYYRRYREPDTKISDFLD